MTDARVSLFDAPTEVDDVLAQTAGPTHRNDPATSRQAARSNACRSGSQRHRVLKALAAAAGDGMTDYELGVHLGILRTAAGTRRKELEERGLVVRTARTRRTDMGEAALVHLITDDGRRVLAEIEAATNNHRSSS